MACCRVMRRGGINVSPAALRSLRCVVRASEAGPEPDFRFNMTFVGANNLLLSAQICVMYALHRQRYPPRRRAR